MPARSRTLRQEQIEDAAYAMLEDRGYAGTSMQGIASLAKASNETLYKWYGDKQGLFKALVTRNASEVKSLLDAELSNDRDPLSILGRMGPVLLKLLLGNRAVALNRAAAADPTGELGATLSKAGRETIFPLIEQVFERARRNGQLSFDRSDDAVGIYLDLLVGDLQVRRIIGRIGAPTPEFCNARSDRAIAMLRAIMPSDGA